MGLTLALPDDCDCIYRVPWVVGPLHTYKKHVICKCQDQDKIVGVRKTETDTLFGP